MKIDTTNWKDFVFSDLIDDIHKAKAHAKVELTVSDKKMDGYIPFVTRTETDNGVDCYVLAEDLQDIEQGNAIVIGDTTATISYQPEPFGTGDHIIVIRSKWINKYTGLFIVGLLQKERFRYSYGRAFLMNSIKNTKLKLPVAQDDTPNWEWIESYIKKQMDKTLKWFENKSKV